MRIRWVRLLACLATLAASAWWWAHATPDQVTATLLLTVATLHGYHAALLIGPLLLVTFLAWLLWPLARPPKGAS